MKDKQVVAGSIDTPESWVTIVTKRNTKKILTIEEHSTLENDKAEEEQLENFDQLNLESNNTDRVVVDGSVTPSWAGKIESEQQDSINRVSCLIS